MLLLDNKYFLSYQRGNLYGMVCFFDLLGIYLLSSRTNRLVSSHSGGLMSNHSVFSVS